MPVASSQLILGSGGHTPAARLEESRLICASQIRRIAPQIRLGQQAEETASCAGLTTKGPPRSLIWINGAVAMWATVQGDRPRHPALARLQSAPHGRRPRLRAGPS